MEVITAIKSEVGPGSRRSLSTAVESEASNNNNNSSVAKCVKRRRRCPSLLALSSNNNDNEGGLQLQLPQASPTQVDQSAVTTSAATTTTVKRSSRFRGVSKHRWTGRYEAHLWDKASWNVTQRKKGKQVYLGAYDEEESAARAYDLAAIKYWGTSTFTNFPVADYEKEVEIMENVTKEEYLASLRRRSSGFSRGVSKYRGVARHHHNGRWEARIGRVFGNKYLYLGTYSTQEEAAHAYDIAAIEYRGINAVTNFDLSTYIRWLRSGANGPATQPILPTSNQVNLTANPNLHFSPNPFMTTGTNFGIIPQKQEENILEQKLHITSSMSLSSSSPSSSSSPTALGLLLRSSMFKELVEKNSNGNTDDEENEGNERKKYKSQIVEEEDFGGMFNFNGPSNVPYVCPNSSVVDALPELESKEDNALPLFNQARQSLWNGSLNLPSI